MDRPTAPRWSRVSISVRADFRGHLCDISKHALQISICRSIPPSRSLRSIEHNIQIQLPCSDSMPWARFGLFGGIFQDSCIEVDPPSDPLHNRSCKSRLQHRPIAHQVSSGDNLEVQRARMPACTLLSDCTRTVAAVRLLLTPDARRRQPCAASFCDPSTAAAEYTVNGDELDYQRCRLPTT